MARYNGHKNRNAWNVSLWINNDEGIYRMARNYARSHTLNQTAEYLLEMLPSHTPDGVRYSLSSVRHALVGIR